MPLDGLDHCVDIANEFLVCEPQNRESFLTQEIIASSIALPSLGRRVLNAIKSAVFVARTFSFLKGLGSTPPTTGLG